MPVGSSTISPHLTQLAIARGKRMTGFTYRAVPAVKSTSSEDSRDGSYVTYDAGTFLIPSDPSNTNFGIRPVKGPYLSFDSGSSESTYTLEEYYAYHEADFGEYQRAGGMKHFENMVIATSKRYEAVKESALKAQLFNTSNWSSGAIGSSNQFNNETSNPGDTIRKRWASITKAASFDGDRRNRHIWMNVEALNHLLGHPIFTKRFGNDDGDISSFGTPKMVADYFDLPVENLHIPMATLNSAAEGQTANPDWIWDDAYMWMGLMPPTLSEEEPTSLAQIYLGNPNPSVQRSVEDTGRRKYRWVRQASVGKFHPVDTAAAYLYTGVYS